jgi:hypothetical protein
MPTVSGWHIPLGLMALGAFFVWIAWIALVEYRRAFFADPLSIMSIEVLANILRLGGPGYLAILALVTGVPMLLGGAFFLLLLAGFWISESGGALLRAISTTLGWVP